MVEDSDIIADYQAGMTLRDLAQKYQMSVSAIRYRLDRNKIERRFGTYPKTIICVICGAEKEVNLWSERETCSDACSHKLKALNQPLAYKKSVAYKYPWGSYIYNALKDICDESIEQKDFGRVIPYSLISTKFRYKFGVQLLDPTLRHAIIDYMQTKGYEYEIHSFKKKKKVKLPEGHLPG